MPDQYIVKTGCNLHAIAGWKLFYIHRKYFLRFYVSPVCTEKHLPHRMHSLEVANTLVSRIFMILHAPHFRAFTISHGSWIPAFSRTQSTRLGVTGFSPSNSVVTCWHPRREPMPKCHIYRTQKSNIDTKSGYILKEPPFPKPIILGVSSR